MTRTLVSAHAIPKAWWKSAVVYQIYPSSFADSNGDGVGDLPGVISKLDYLKDLGVDVVWLSPIFKSPQADMGYDISDYKDIHAPYGTVADVERLIAELHKRGMKLLLDLVVNHSSDEHAWFQESRVSKSSKKRDWYIWQPAKYDSDGNRCPPNNWRANLGGGSAWQWDEGSGEYYLHYYDPKQPDLNFDCKEVREAVWDLMRFWLDKGCDGFRMDVIGLISKDKTFPDAPIVDPATYLQELPRGEGPHLHEYLQEMNREVLSHYDIMTVGEMNWATYESMINFVHPDRKELQSGFCFDHVNVGTGKGPIGRATLEPWKLSEFKAILGKWQGLRDLGGWHALYLENHDQPRSVSRYANDSPEWRWESARLLAMMHSTLCGTLYIFQGQEIGMKNLPETWPIEEWKDVKTQNVYRLIRERGEDVEETTTKMFRKARDHGRMPMQWSDEVNAGFSPVKPWMRVNDDYPECNVASQVGKDDSVLAFWREMLALRKEHDDALIYGTFQMLSPEDDEVFAYLRANSILVALNFTDHVVTYEVPVPVVGATIFKATRKEGVVSTLTENKITLAPYQGVMYQLP